MTRRVALTAADQPFTLVLEGVTPLSWNQLNRSVNRFARNGLVKTMHAAVKRAWTAVQSKPPMFTGPVEVECVAYFAGRRYDCDNLTVKSLIDPLKGVLIVNDSPVYVPSVTLISRQDKARPRTELTFRPVANAQKRA